MASYFALKEVDISTPHQLDQAACIAFPMPPTAILFKHKVAKNDYFLDTYFDIKRHIKRKLMIIFLNCGPLTIFYQYAARTRV